ncbi:hypothetical protein GOP47_0001586 [Adiantum capillus-veneris]|uniref:X8 domain-containing protein n=1 Tax=Adiantum capillus-veneris TaxID=13818 RepID=A0A9D4VA00_ADICA|nr:hypothetical protein GOP47_0001586 [Adiantum capillus-veneris]
MPKNRSHVNSESINLLVPESINGNLCSSAFSFAPLNDPAIAICSCWWLGRGSQCDGWADLRHSDSTKHNPKEQLTTADCSAIRLGAPCFLPNTIFHHASYAFNSYYQMNAKGAGTCSFGSAATLTTEDPSNGMCVFPSSTCLDKKVVCFGDET